MSGKQLNKHNLSGKQLNKHDLLGKHLNNHGLSGKQLNKQEDQSLSRSPISVCIWHNKANEPSLLTCSNI